MKVGDLVRSVHTKDLFGIIIRGSYTNIVEEWLVQWNNQKRSYEREEHLEAVC